MALKKYNRHSVIFTWLLSYVVILLLPVIIFGVGYSRSSKIIENEVTRVNSGLLKQVQQSMDTRFEDIEKITRQLSVNSKARVLANASQPISSFQQYNIYQLVEDIRAISDTNGFVDELYIYFKDIGSIVNSKMHIDGELFYNQFYQFEGMSYEEWFYFLNDIHNKDYTILNQKKTNGETARKIVYLQSIFLDSSTESFATVVILIDEARFRSDAENIQMINHGSLMVLDKNNNVLLSTSPEITVSEISPGKMAESSGMFEMDNKDIVVSYIVSGVSGIKYVSLAPNKLYWAQKYQMTAIIQIALVLSLLLGGVAVFYLLKKNYIPVRNILQQMLGTGEDSGLERLNEYKLIQTVFSGVASENKRVREKLSQYDNEMRSNLIRNLLRGRLGNVIEDRLTAFDINFSTSFFAVILFNIDSIEHFFRDEKDLDEYERQRLARFIMTNVAEDLVNRNNQGYMVEMDNKVMACLINCRDNSGEDTQQELYGIAQEAQQFIQDNFNIYFTVAISSVHETFTGIPEAYNESMEVMEYKIVTGTRSIISHSDIANKKESKFYYDYSIETEYKLINSIKTGSFEDARAILDKVFSDNFGEEGLSVQMARCLMFDLAGTLMKTTGEITGLNDHFVEETGVMERMLASDDIAEMRTQMTDVLKMVCEYVAANKKKGHGPLIEKIEAYIAANYHNSSLSIAMLAEVFEMSPSYIGGLFKEETGTGLLDYINKVRIENAKQLLVRTEHNIQEVAEMAGYGSSNVFIRTFKKYAGITPGKYREMNS
jgi:YesN/AraC family two-component response regulator